MIEVEPNDIPDALPIPEFIKLNPLGDHRGLTEYKLSYQTQRAIAEMINSRLREKYERQHARQRKEEREKAFSSLDADEQTRLLRIADQTKANSYAHRASLAEANQRLNAAGNPWQTRHAHPSTNTWPDGSPLPPIPGGIYTPRQSAEAQHNTEGRGSNLDPQGEDHQEPQATTHDNHREATIRTTTEQID